MTINIEIGIGEALDRLSILAIKLEKIKEFDKLVNVQHEYDHLVKKLSEAGWNDIEMPLYLELKKANQELWDVEDNLRVLEAKKDFRDLFVQLARMVYYTNDNRAAIKRKLNIQYSSSFIEEKSYQPY